MTNTKVKVGHPLSLPPSSLPPSFTTSLIPAPPFVCALPSAHPPSFLCRHPLWVPPLIARTPFLHPPPFSCEQGCKPSLSHSRAGLSTWATPLSPWLTHHPPHVRPPPPFAQMQGKGRRDSAHPPLPFVPRPGLCHPISEPSPHFMQMGAQKGQCTRPAPSTWATPLCAGCPTHVATPFAPPSSCAPPFPGPLSASCNQVRRRDSIPTQSLPPRLRHPSPQFMCPTLPTTLPLHARGHRRDSASV